MSFLIVVLSAQQAFIGLGGIRVSAATTPTPGNGKIIQVQTYSQYMGQSGYTNSYGNDGAVNGEYTGKILPQSVSMYDYLTDYEKNNSKWNKLSGNQSNYTYYARYEPYKQFNRAISALASLGTTTIPASENITIIYKSLRFKNTDDVRVYLWDSANSNNKTAWPGLDMNYVGRDGDFYKFSVTFNLGFAPDRLIFSNNGSDLYKTLDISCSMQSGHKYTFEDSRDAVNGSTCLIYRTGTDYGASFFIHLWLKDGSGNLLQTTDWDHRPSMTQDAVIDNKSLSVNYFL